MKLIRCYIENFGKLHNFKYEFQNTLNIIKEENGFGKTTFATFIKSMFYGLDSGANVKIENSERKKYMPWQGGIYGGNIEFEIKNKKYRIERAFGKKQVDDIFKLYDLSTNLESKDYTENIGEELFQINKAGYERSTYIPQGKIQIEMEDSLSAKLGNILESDNDINTSEQALKRLIDSKKVIKKDKGKGGLIDEKEDKLNKLKRELENSKTDASILEEKKKKLENKLKELNEAENERKDIDRILSEKIEQDRRIAKKETYKTIKSKYKQYEDKKNELNKFLTSENMNKFKDQNITEDKIDNAIKSCYKLPELEKELQIKKEEKDKIQKTIKINKKILFILLISASLIVILGIIFIAAKRQLILGIIGIITGIILTCISLVISHKTKKYNLIEYNKQIQNMEADKQEIDIQLEQLLKNNDILDKIVALTNLKSEYNLLQMKKNEYNTIENQFEFAKKEKEKFELENDIDELNNIGAFTDIQEADLREKIFEVNKKIDLLVDEKNQLKNSIEFLENKIDDNEFLEADIENLENDIEELSQKYEILNKTEELLRTAKQSFSSNYLQEMITGFKQYLNVINKKDMNTNVDIKLDVKVDENGSQKDIKYFSYGYRDLIYICMRFSLIQALFKEEKPFVILDDPFVNLDEEKTKKALEVLNEFSKDFQIIYFVCNSSRTPKN